VTLSPGTRLGVYEILALLLEELKQRVPAK
jgi:hypothetical protein